jgi:hypothetical protein
MAAGLLGGTVMLLGHAGAFAWIVAVTRRQWQMPRQIRDAERLARASLSAQTISD